MLSYEKLYFCHFLYVLRIGTMIDYGSMFAEHKQRRIQK